MASVAQSNYRVPFSGVGYRYEPEDVDAVAQVMKTASTLTQGSYQEAFERDLAKFIGVQHAFATTSAATAFELAALLAKVGPNDEVIVPAHTYCVSAYPFARHGARIRWADIERDTFLMSEDSVRSLLTERTKIIVAVHLYGLPANLRSLRGLADEVGALLVEDCAQSIGATFEGARAGSFGDMSIFSFQSHKNVSTLGEGGMLAVNDPQLARWIPGLRHNGHRPFDRTDSRYWHPAMSDVGFDMPGVWPHNFCMTEPQAALGSRLLPRVDSINARRRARYYMAVETLQEFPEVVFQNIPQERLSSHHLLPFRYDGQQHGACNHDFIERLAVTHGIQPATQYYPLYRYELFSGSGNGEADCPNSDEFFDNMVSLPFHIWMEDSDFSYLLASVAETAEHLRKHGGSWFRREVR